MNRYERCILATCPLPWDEKFNFLEEIFRQYISKIVNEGTKHIYIFGTAGEGHAVSDGQFYHITEVFLDEMKKRGANPMIGIISLSLSTIIERIQNCSKIGVKRFQISLPAWGQCSFDEIRRFFSEICGRFSECDFLHYNTGRSKRVITPDEYAILQNLYPNFVATKNGANSPIGILNLHKQAPLLQHFHTEIDFCVASLLGVESAFLISVASINWARAKEFYVSCASNIPEKTREFMVELNGILQSLFAVVGTDDYTDGAYDKIFCRMHCDEFPLRLLPPYRYCNDEVFCNFKNILKKKYPKWVISC